MWKNGDKVVALNSWDGSQYNKGVGARSLCYPPNQDIIYDKGEVFTVDMYMDSPGKVCFKERRRGFTYNPANFTVLIGEAPIPVGTRVRIADRGHTYTTYSAWKGHELVGKRMGEGAVKWKSHTFELGIDVNNLEGVVIEFEQHTHNKSYGILYAVQLDNTSEYIVIGRDGLEVLDAATEKKEVKAEAVATAAEVLRRQLQSRIDKRSNEIQDSETSVALVKELLEFSRRLKDCGWSIQESDEKFCKKRLQARKEELKMLASEQSLDKRLMAVLVKTN